MNDKSVFVEDIVERNELIRARWTRVTRRATVFDLTLHFFAAVHICIGLTTKVSGAGAPKVRRAPTQAMRMPKAWPVLASA